MTLHHRNCQTSRQHDVGHGLPHHRGDNAAADDGRERGATPDVVAGQLADLDDQSQHADTEQHGGENHKKIDLIGGKLREPEHSVGETETHVVHHEIRVKLRMGKIGIVDMVAEKEIQDRQCNQSG